MKMNNFSTLISMGLLALCATVKSMEMNVVNVSPGDKVPLQTPLESDNGTMWLMVDNKTSKTFGVFIIGGNPFVFIKGKTKLTINKPIPLVSSLAMGAPEYVKTTTLIIKDTEENADLLQLVLSQDYQAGVFMSFLVHLPSLKKPNMDEEEIKKTILSFEQLKFDPLQGRVSYSIQLTLDGDNLEKSKVEIAPVQY